MVSLIVSCFLSCYPLSTGAIKWRIKWDKNLVKSKKFLKIRHWFFEKQPM